MKQKFIEWFTKNNNGCSPAMEDDRSFVREKTQHMFEAYLAGVAEGEARYAALVAENAGLKSIQEWAVADVFKTGAKRFESTKAAGFDTDDCLHDAVLVMLSELQTPATEAFLAEVRAHDLNAFIRHHSAELDAHIKNGGEQFDEKSVRIRDIIVSARLFREQIRKEAAQ
ncbi:TPA: hypothetical protein L1V86_004544 [Enterobacter cloacae]|uniref:hypothetical protein n=1 Tax=Enterobacter cloacae TaxID=550 RepID=UPI001F20938A|nr:hypothetical protein [Enterobacter cloacae]HBN1091999.1 hypothetical protein [Enterobacter cloacae]